MIHVVEIKNFAFSPSDLKITAGDSIKWHNSDGTRHSAKREQAPIFDTGLIAPGGDSIEVKFDDCGEGEVEYFCEPHPHMVGRITISVPRSDPGSA